MATAAQEFRNRAATCLRLSKTMDDENKRQLEEIARRWLALAEQKSRAIRGIWKLRNKGGAAAAGTSCGHLSKPETMRRSHVSDASFPCV